MLSLESNDSSKSDTSLKSDFISEGSYGCVYYPGINCKGKKNNKKMITKIQEINFHSINEKDIGIYIKKNIKRYYKYFNPIQKFCIVKFNTIEKSHLDINKCDTLFDEYNSQKQSESGNSAIGDVVNEQYFLMYSAYIYNLTLIEFYGKYDGTNFVFSLLHTLAFLLNSLIILQKYEICHNDLHENNILINMKNYGPIIIDFGLAFKKSSCYKLNKDYIDFQFLKKFVFDYRPEFYQFVIEKKFISFIIYNKTMHYPNEIYDNNERNILSKDAIALFIKDTCSNIRESPEIIKYITESEMTHYNAALEKFYYQFLNTEEFPDYNSIVAYLLDFVFIYTDLYSMCINVLHIRYKRDRYFTSFEPYHDASSDDDIFLLHFFTQLYKKVLYPDPNMRLQLSQVLDLYNFIISYIKKYDLKDSVKDSVKDSIKLDFVTSLIKFLKYKSIDIKTVFYKNFAFLNFNLLCTNNIFKAIQDSTIFY